MARTLMDTIRGNLEAKPEGGGVQDQTERTQQLLRAKTGKAAGTDSAPRLSNVQEQQAASQTRLGLSRLQQQGQLKSQQIQQQAEQVRVQEKENLANLMEQRQDITQRFQLQAENIANQLARTEAKLDDKERASKFEQFSTLMRAQDQTYLQELKREGERGRLLDSLNFKEQAARQNFEDMKGLLEGDIAYRKIADMNQRELQDEIARMEFSQIQEMAHQQQMTQMRQAKWKAVGMGTQAATSYYGDPNRESDYQSSPFKTWSDTDRDWET